MYSCGLLKYKNRQKQQQTHPPPTATKTIKQSTYAQTANTIQHTQPHKKTKKLTPTNKST